MTSAGALWAVCVVAALAVALQLGGGAWLPAWRAPAAKRRPAGGDGGVRDDAAAAVDAALASTLPPPPRAPLHVDWFYNATLVRRRSLPVWSAAWRVWLVRGGGHVCGVADTRALTCVAACRLNAARGQAGDIDGVRAALANGSVPVDALSSVGATALNAAALRGNLEMARVLLDAGADVDAPQVRLRANARANRLFFFLFFFVFFFVFFFFRSHARARSTTARRRCWARCLAATRRWRSSWSRRAPAT